MIDTIDSRLKEWVQAQFANVAVEFGPPSTGDEATRPVVHIYLLHVVPGLTRMLTPTHNGAESELILRYLVVVSGEPAEAHHILGELAFAALDAVDFEVDQEPLGAEVWSALGALPQPALLLRVPLRRQRPQPDIPLVRVPLVVEQASLSSLNGQVLGPDDLPMAGAVVEMPGLRLRQTTDTRGRFTFKSVPVQEQQTLLVRAKGRETLVDVGPSGRGQPVIIRLNPFEEEG